MKIDPFSSKAVEVKMWEDACDGMYCDALSLLSPYKEDVSLVYRYVAGSSLVAIFCSHSADYR